MVVLPLDNSLPYHRETASLRFDNFDPRRERIFQLINMRNHQNQVKVILDSGNRFYQPFTPNIILRTKPLINEQRSQFCARPPRQQLTQRNPNSEIDTECLAAAIQAVIACAEFIRDQNIEGFNETACFLLALRIKANMHPVTAHATE